MGPSARRSWQRRRRRRRKRRWRSIDRGGSIRHVQTASPGCVATVVRRYGETQKRISKGVCAYFQLYFDVDKKHHDCTLTADNYNTDECNGAKEYTWVLLLDQGAPCLDSPKDGNHRSLVRSYISEPCGTPGSWPCTLPLPLPLPLPFPLPVSVSLSLYIIVSQCLCIPTYGFGAGMPRASGPCRAKGWCRAIFQ